VKTSKKFYDANQMTRKKIVKNQRLLWADITRVVAIFLVVYIHQLYLLPPLTFSTLLFWTPQLFANIGVPLFVLISGSLLLPKQESLKVFFRKRVRSVLVPWVFWIGVYSIVAIGIFGQQVFPFGSFIKFEYQLFFSRFWFLPMIFGLYLLTPMLRPFVKHASNSTLYYAVILWFVTIVCIPILPAFFGHPVIPDTTLPYFILQYLGLYILGYILIYRNHLVSDIRFWVALFFVSIILTYTATFFDSLPEYPLVDRTFSRVFSPTFIPASISIFMILYLKFRNVTKINTKLRWLITEASKSVLGIYLVHELVQEYFTYSFPAVNSFFSMISPLLAIPFRAVVVFFLSFVIIFFMKRVPILRSVAG
jgi:surface polysaccharide O-acyltransferase-like enzyme